MSGQQLPKNIARIQRVNLIVGSIGVTVVCLIFLALNQIPWIFSAVLGSIVSYIVLHNLMISQTNILMTRNKNLFFFHYLFRLGLYAIPIVVFFQWKSYLNLGVILVFLWTFQITHIGMETWRHYIHYKRRQEKWKVSEK